MPNTRALLVSLVAVACLASPVVSSAAACTDTFANASGGAWGTPGNWSAGLPTSTSDVCIALPAGRTVTLAPFVNTDAGASVASVTLSSGTLVVSGQASISSSNETENETHLSVSGSMSIAAGATVVLDSTAGGSPQAGNADGGIAYLNVAGSLTNSGLLATQVEDPAWGDTLQASSIANAASGSIAVDSGALTVTQPSPFSWTATNSGSLAVAAGASLKLATSFAGNGSLTNAGTVANAGSIGIASTSGATTWTQSGGTLTGNPVVLGARATLVDSVGAGQFTLGTGSTLTGTIPAGQTVTVEGDGGQNGTQVSLGNATLVNDGSLVLDVPGSGTASGGSVNLGSGSIQNNARLVAQIEDPSWRVLFQVGLANAPAGSLTISGGTFDQNGTGTVNDGLVTLTPDATFQLEEGAAFANAADGTVSAQIAGAASFGHFQTSSACCAGAGSISAGGTLSPALVGGFVPGAGEEFQLFQLSGPFSGTFASVAGGFGADYAHEAASPEYVGAVYGAAPAPAGPGAPAPVVVAPSVAHVGAVSGGRGTLTVKLTCPSAAACPVVVATDVVFEHLKGAKLLSVTAAAGKRQAKVTTRQVVIASGSTSLAAHAAKTLTLTVNAKGRALLVRFARLASHLTISSGGRTLRSSAVSVLRPAKSKKKPKKA